MLPVPSFLLPLAFVLVQAGIILFVPAASAGTAYIAMVAAPALAGVAALWRGWRERGPARMSWCTLSVAFFVWSLGAFGNLWHEWVEGRADEMYRDAMLLFNLAAVPITFLLASEWKGPGRVVARAIDAITALALCYAYFRLTMDTITVPIAPGSDDPAILVVWLIDAENLFIAVCALLRWYAAEDPAERNLFRALAMYAVVFFLIVYGNDHYAAGDPALGPQVGSVVTFAFALFAVFALRAPSKEVVRPVHNFLTRAVRASSPVMMARALLVVSLFLVRVDYPFGVIGILIAAVGYSLRNTMAHVRHVERGEAMQRERRELQTIAWTDALTGVPNRHFFDKELRRAWRSERRSGLALSILMVDIDHFKSLNDHYGHPAGDACLRAVARILQESLVRPDDILARYGGEEFIALLREADTTGAKVVAERLREAVRNLKIEHRASPFGIVTVSVGAASASCTSEAAAARLVEAADRALYEAKCAGRDQVGSQEVAVA
jgi:diguanylate cyclase (GGDEF)-like protein